MTQSGLAIYEVLNNHIKLVANILGSSVLCSHTLRLPIAALT